MNHNRHIHIVKMPVCDQFGLATQKAQFSLFDQIQPVFDLHKFLCGHGKKHDPAREIACHAGIDHAHHRAHQPRDLRVVPTRMRRARLRIGLGMIGHQERIEFADQRDRRAWRAALQNALHARNRQLGLAQHAKFIHRLRHQLGGFKFLKPQFGICHNALANATNLIAPPIYRLANALLEFGF